MSCTPAPAFDAALAWQRYRQDRYFHALVDSMTSLLASRAMTETDLAAAVQLAGVLQRDPASAALPDTRPGARSPHVP